MIEIFIDLDESQKRYVNRCKWRTIVSAYPCGIYGLSLSTYLDRYRSLFISTEASTVDTENTSCVQSQTKSLFVSFKLIGVHKMFSPEVISEQFHLKGAILEGF